MGNSYINAFIIKRIFKPFVTAKPWEELVARGQEKVVIRGGIQGSIVEDSISACDTNTYLDTGRTSMTYIAEAFNDARKLFPHWMCFDWPTARWHTEAQYFNAEQCGRLLQIWPDFMLHVEKELEMAGRDKLSDYEKEVFETSWPIVFKYVVDEKDPNTLMKICIYND